MSSRFDREIGVRSILFIGVGLALLVALSSGALWFFSTFLRSWEESLDPAPPPLAAAQAPYEPPGPRLQEDPAKEMRELRQAEEEMLGSYGWVDEAAGIARIPIERAISLAVGDGGPVEESPLDESDEEAAH